VPRTDPPVEAFSPFVTKTPSFGLKRRDNRVPRNAFVPRNHPQ
jgi:hypothetical protein